MYYRFGIEENIKNLFRISSKFIKDKSQISSLEDLRPSYLRRIEELSDFPINYGKEKFIRDEKTFNQLKNVYGVSDLNDLKQEKVVGSFPTKDELDRKFNLLEKAIQVIKSMDPKLYELYSFVNHSFIISELNYELGAPKSYGGSSSRCIGLSWFTFPENINEIDAVELIFHEYIHHLVFIDEMNYGHFNYELMPNPDFWAFSSILKRIRPMDKVVHSIIVAGELLLFRKRFRWNGEKTNIHPNSSHLIESFQKSINSVLQHPFREKICLPRTLSIISYYNEIIKELK